MSMHDRLKGEFPRAAKRPLSGPQRTARSAKGAT
jgi:hypothetical protein